MKRSLLAFLLMFNVQAFAKTSQPFDGYIVKLKKGKSLNTLNAKEQFSTFAGDFAVVQGDQKSLEMLKSDPAVEYVEPNYIISVAPAKRFQKGIMADARYAQQWGLKNTGRNSGGWFSPGKRGEDIKAESAWRTSMGSSDIIVAVIDTGVDYDHEDLGDNMLMNTAEANGEPGVDDDGNGYVDDVYGYDFANNDGDPQDGHGHGTHCAGVIGAIHDNGKGIRGVMKNVKILGIKFLGDNGSGSTAAAIKSVDYAIKRGAHVLSNSWGGGGRSQALLEVIQAADEQKAVFVAAAGNSRANNDSSQTFPANYEVENVISVGAMDGRGRKASFSNYGAQKVHVFAPGVNTLSTVPGGYKNMSGTSMATPHVSGVVGLLLSERPDLTPAQIRQILIESSRDNGSLRSYSQSRGTVNAADALTKAVSY